MCVYAVSCAVFVLKRLRQLARVCVFLGVSVCVYDVCMTCMYACACAVFYAAFVLIRLRYRSHVCFRESVCVCACVRCMCVFLRAVSVCELQAACHMRTVQLE